MMGMHIVITGSPVDGFNYFGPFKTGDAARDWAEYHVDGGDWWLAPLEAPESYGDEPDGDDYADRAEQKARL